jgi:hypothetical protein
MLCMTVISHWPFDRVITKFASPFLSGMILFSSSSRLDGVNSFGVVWAGAYVEMRVSNSGRVRKKRFIESS